MIHSPRFGSIVPFIANEQVYKEFQSRLINKKVPYRLHVDRDSLDDPFKRGFFTVGPKDTAEFDRLEKQNLAYLSSPPIEQADLDNENGVTDRLDLIFKHSKMLDWARRLVQTADGYKDEPLPMLFHKMEALQDDGKVLQEDWSIYKLFKQLELLGSDYRKGIPSGHPEWREYLTANTPARNYKTGNGIAWVNLVDLTYQIDQGKYKPAAEA